MAMSCTKLKKKNADLNQHRVMGGFSEAVT